MSATRFNQFLQNQPKLTVCLILLVPAFLLVALMKAAGANQPESDESSPLIQQVQVVNIQRQEVYKRFERVVGRVEANKTARLGFERGGTLMASLVDEGQQVKKGQLLAELDTQRLVAQMQEIDAGIERAKADARLAMLSEKRIAKLVAEKLESPQRLDETREATLAAQALVNEMEARKESIEVEFSKSKIFAPFNGTLLSRPVDPGSVVAQGMAVFTIQQDASAEVRMAMASDKAFSLQPEGVYKLTANGRSLSGELKSIAKIRATDTRTVDTIFSISSNDSQNQHPILPGDLLTLLLPIETPSVGYWVPRTALASGIRGMWTIFVLEEGSPQSSVVSKAVNVLYSEEDRVYVTGSLNVNESVVLNGGHRLVTNQKVSATIVPMPQAKATTVLAKFN